MYFFIWIEKTFMEGNFVVVGINGANRVSKKLIERVDIVNGDEPEGVFMHKMTGHRVEKEKPAFIIDHKDEAS